MSRFELIAHNYSESSENRIHSDEIAKKFGFRGALVPGVAVYGYLTRAVVEAYGEAWLGQSVDHVRLLKPTYDGEAVVIESAEEDGQLKVTSYDPEGQLTAVLTCNTTNALPELEDIALLEGSYKHPERVEISWDTVEPLQAFTPWQVTLTPEENKRYTDEALDNLPMYQQGVVHPHWLQSLANTALMNEYIMPTWIHAGSETRHRHLLREGDEITIRSVPMEKWRNKGHEFIRLWVTYWRDGVITTDIMHTAIFKVAT